MSSSSDSESLALASTISNSDVKYTTPDQPPISPPRTPRPAPAAVLPPEIVLKILNDASKLEQMDAMTSPIIRPTKEIQMEVDEQAVEDTQVGGVQMEGEQAGGGEVGVGGSEEKMQVDEPEGRDQAGGNGHA